ncbi:MAG: TIGR03619 family F420-dependent LLM class oxidoreductase [Thermomicrobiales bacterium]
MRFGVVLPTYPAGATVAGVIAVAQAAEALGYVSVWTTDHVILPAGQAYPYDQILEPLLTLATVAPLTNRVKLGISVIVVSQRNGIVLAKELATLDQLCGGRLIAGVGAGWSADEFRMLDAGDRFTRRGAYLDETLRLWRHLWRTPGTPFQGEFYDLPAVDFGPPPVQPDGPPIWVGGSSEGARRRAGRYGAAWHPVGDTAATLASQAALVRESATAAGRPVPEIAPRLPIQFGTGGKALSAGSMQTISGSPDEIAAQLAAYRDAGVSEIDCFFGGPHADTVIAQMETFAREVIPALNS